MIGLVLVSHSPMLAGGVLELLSQLAPDVPVRVAAGTDDGRIGTSPDAVAVALGRVGADQVVVLADLGSAVLSVRVALEDLDPARYVLVDAPFVEGAVSAAVTAGTGADLTAVVQAAEEARTIPKF